MLLKKVHDIPEGWEPEYEGMDKLRAALEQSGLSADEQEAQLQAYRSRARIVNEPPLKALELQHTGTTAPQNFSRKLVEQWLAAGVASLSEGVLTLKTTEEDLKYTVTRMPGTYCCHCDARLTDDPSGASGRTHVQQMHAGEVSPDPSNPSGFRQTHAYECVLDEAQHAQWNAAARAVATETEAVQQTSRQRGRPREEQRS